MYMFLVKHLHIYIYIHTYTHMYLKDLEPACVSGDSSYEERKGARDDEIAGLKQAQGILKDYYDVI